MTNLETGTPKLTTQSTLAVIVEDEREKIRRKFDDEEYKWAFIGLWFWAFFSNLFVIMFSFLVMKQFLEPGKENAFATYGSLFAISFMSVVFEVWWVFNKNEFWKFLSQYDNKMNKMNSEERPCKYRVQLWLAKKCFCSDNTYFFACTQGLLNTFLAKLDFLQDTYFVIIARSLGWKQDLVLISFVVAYGVQNFPLIFAIFKGMCSKKHFTFGHQGLYAADLKLTQRWLSHVWYKRRGSAYMYFAYWPLLRMIVETIPQLVIQMLFLVGSDAPEEVSSQRIAFVAFSASVSLALGLMETYFALQWINKDWIELWATERVPELAKPLSFTKEGTYWQEPCCQICCCFCCCCPFDFRSKDPEMTLKEAILEGPASAWCCCCPRDFWEPKKQVDEEEKKTEDVGGAEL